MRTPDKWDEFEKAMWDPTVSDETRHSARVTHDDLRRMNFPEPAGVWVNDGVIGAVWAMSGARLCLYVNGGSVSWDHDYDY